MFGFKGGGGLPGDGPPSPGRGSKVSVIDKDQVNVDAVVSHQHAVSSPSIHSDLRRPLDSVAEFGGEACPAFAVMGDQHQRVDLPTELIYSILLRLPVKSLTRFKSVSKSLSNLISHPSFQQDHYLHRKPLPNPLLFLLTETNRRTRTHTLRFSTPLTNFSKTIPIKRIHDHEPTGFVLIGSCLGLVCIASASDRTILVCNPSTQEIASLPQPPVQGFIQCVGFGYASSQFKVVRFFNLERYGPGENCCEVFTLGSSDGWRRTVSPPYNPKWGGPFLNGAIHLIMSDEAYGEGYKDSFIAAFDVDAEKYQTVPLPKIGEVLLYTHDTHLVVLRGSLCLAFYFETRKVLELWFLKDYDDGKWVKEYDIDFSLVDGVFLPYPVSFMGDGRILLSVYCGGGQYEHCWYNTQERCFGPKERHENCSIRLFVETFVPLRTEISGRQRLLLPYP